MHPLPGLPGPNFWAQPTRRAPGGALEQRNMSPVRRASDRDEEDLPDEGDGPLVPEVDLHGKRPEDALRHLARELHSARHRRLGRVLVITGQGLGNALQKPILRGKVEAWLLGPEGQRLGVQGFERTSRGGALLVRLAGSPASG